MIAEKCLGCGQQELQEASLGALGLTNGLTGGQRALLWTAAAATIGTAIGAALSARRRRGRGAAAGLAAGLALGLLPAAALWRTD